jgi:hypothetical protein
MKHLNDYKHHRLEHSYKARSSKDYNSFIDRIREALK